MNFPYRRGLFFWLLAAGNTFSAEYYVATNGSNTATGSLIAPWATIQYAVNQAVAGDTVYVRGGSFHERVVFNHSGTAGNPLTLKNYNGEAAVIDGTGFTVASGWDALVTLTGRSYITIDGLEIRNMITAVKSCVPVGVLVSGASKGVVLRNLKIHDIETNWTGTSNGDAHGLAAYGDSASGSISNLLIEAVEIYDCRLGSSESMVLNGNVENFVVKNCVVHDNNNIGIDFIGYEGTCSTTSLDQARNGQCIGNLVYNIATTGNPAYGTDRSADGIYVDGGRDIIMERNVVHDCDIGMEIASEHSGKSTSYITLRNNLVYRNYNGGIFAGGYDSKRGKAEYCTIIGNTLYGNDTAKVSNGEIYLQMYVENCVFENNLVYALTNSGNSAVFVGGIGVSGSKPVNTQFNYNLYFSPISSANHVWTWGNTTYSSFSTWKGVGNDSNAVYNVNPLLTDPSGGDLHIGATSPAVNSGTNRTDRGTFDIDGQPRLYGTRVDIGSDEYYPYTTNGTPYVWLNRYGLTNEYATADGTDDDHDGMTAWQEYQAGTDPADSNSVFRIISSGQQLVWTGGTNEANTPFQVWRSSDLTRGTWEFVTNVSRQVGSNGTNIWQVPLEFSGTERQFYRITAPKE